MTAVKKATIGGLLTKRVLGIDPEARFKQFPKDLRERAKETIFPAQLYWEEEPTVTGWLHDLKPTKEGSIRYTRSLFPSLDWVPRYNWRWLFGDAIAGLTIGFVVIPQAMAYAILAQLTPEYGLYTSFTGAVFYWLFGTSKDIVIGTTAVGSLLVGSVVSKINEASESGELSKTYENEEIARTLSLVAGFVLLFLGLFRLGWIIEFIPYVPISAFVTAASITIMSTQAPVALGINHINTREAPYKVIINTLKGLPRTQLDAAIGLSCLFMLFMIREFCSYMEKRQPQRKRMWTTINSLRQTFAMLLYTIIAYLVHMNIPKEELDNGGTKFRLVGNIERGFSQARIPTMDSDLVTHILPELPAIVIILIIEHIAIAKSFGRIFNYTIVPSQEILAQGAANVFSPFVGGYVCTGSFGASAVLSKAGVRTPLAGLFSAFILVLALYALTGVFYFIPNAALAGLIIHAVSNLLTPPRSLYKYWQLSPFELILWVIGVMLALFQNLEISIYVTIGLSLALLLIRLARTQGRFLGKVTVRQISDEVASRNSDNGSCELVQKHKNTTHDVFIPLDRNDSTNPAVKIPPESPYPGVFIYRFPEGFNYTNSGHHIDSLLTYITSHTRRTTAETFERESDRMWNDNGASRPKNDDKPLLRAVVLDFSAVNNVDITAVQALVDLRASLDRHASPEPVEWHFAHINNQWTRRALAVAGFGFPTTDNPLSMIHWSPRYMVAPLIGELPEKNQDGRILDEEEACEGVSSQKHNHLNRDCGGPGAEGDAASATTSIKSTFGRYTNRYISYGKVQQCAVLYGVNRPFFHIDLIVAVEAAVRDAHRADEKYTDESESIVQPRLRRTSCARPDSPIGEPITPADSRGVNP